MRHANFINLPFTLTRSLASTVATPKRVALLDGYESPEPGPVTNAGGPPLGPLKAISARLAEIMRQ
jgi:hypothetical protein